MPEAISLKLPARLPLAEIDRAAESLGMNRNQFLVTAIEFYVNLDPGLISMLEKYAAQLKLPVFLVAQNLLIWRMAEVAADIAIHGGAAKVFSEFKFDSNGLITGKKLFDILKNEFIQAGRIHLFDEMAKSEDATGERLRRIEKALREAGIPEDEAEALKAAVVWAARPRAEAADQAKAGDNPGDGPGGQERG